MRRQSERDTFGPIYHKDLESPEVVDLPYGPWRLWATLQALTFAGQDQVDVSTAQLAQLTRASQRSTVRKWARFLEDVGLLRRDFNQRGDAFNDVNTWVILDPPSTRSTRSKPSTPKTVEPPKEASRRRSTPKRRVRDLDRLMGELAGQLGDAQRILDDVLRGCDLVVELPQDIERRANDLESFYREYGAGAPGFEDTPNQVAQLRKQAAQLRLAPPELPQAAQTASDTVNDLAARLAAAQTARAAAASEHERALVQTA